MLAALNRHLILAATSHVTLRDAALHSRAPSTQTKLPYPNSVCRSHLTVRCILTCYAALTCALAASHETKKPPPTPSRDTRPTLHLSEPTNADEEGVVAAEPQEAGSDWVEPAESAETHEVHQPKLSSRLVPTVRASHSGLVAHVWQNVQAELMHALHKRAPLSPRNSPRVTGSPTKVSPRTEDAESEQPAAAAPEPETQS